jgi:hypothetical protein
MRRCWLSSLIMFPFCSFIKWLVLEVAMPDIEFIRGEIERLRLIPRRAPHTSRLFVGRSGSPASPWSGLGRTSNTAVIAILATDQKAP